jgi:hypothetical protein
MTPASTAEQPSTGRSEGAHSRSAVPGVRSQDAGPATSASELTPNHCLCRSEAGRLCASATYALQTRVPSVTQQRPVVRRRPTPTRRKLPHAPNHRRRHRNGHLRHPSPVHPALPPRHNGKAERCNRILSEGFLYARGWISETQRSEAVVVWNVRYNYRRSHASDHLAQQPGQPFREASNSTLSLIHHAG